ncbi:MAG: hypothetical protein KUA35_10290 [Pseudodesulfovibrio sp.]|uniref:Uncharacterized protein n=1 Tax=Pseudodesulfovibrio aespoeensis (strain ATCC 700646 / DSM 10631 / Aspo-2) TaxID=643562 RepID=E6VUB3_PSEA9|nr:MULTISPECIES: hypothetical protein [Pseudodesulfovibrio]MBU4191353.1 hypothetical protein [Pseudomonadota bacterium]ADU63420.1 hypothetical protein Daes_2415 [Pseudodesulfovibrio aespoeensis Aspo-2]MBU4243467.1 hypothetical protein [Pseudomonadota bacterium]MBU4380030.1 hypothetical protein [Pseudomonadota bacterium]MBU4473801.1 hypothetical protein [Pseudomonadota bacterium]
MAEGDKSRTMSYLRAFFPDNKALTLCEYLAAAHRRVTTVADRTFTIDGQEVKCCHEERKRDPSTKERRQYVHVSVSTPGEPVSLVPQGGQNKEVDLGTAVPPQGNDFMDGDLMLLVQDNHVLFCSTGLRVSKAKEYLMHLLEKTGQPEEALAFSLVSVADVDKVRMIREKGVKRLHLSAGLFPATLDHLKRTTNTMSEKVVKAVTEEFLEICKKDESLAQYSEAENLTAEIILKYDRRFKGGELGQKRIESLAEMAVDEGDDGFKIVTGDGETISASTITLRKEIKVPKYGKTVRHESVWAEMRTYLKELRNKGLLDQ